MMQQIGIFLQTRRSTKWNSSIGFFLGGHYANVCYHERTQSSASCWLLRSNSFGPSPYEVQGCGPFEGGKQPPNQPLLPLDLLRKSGEFPMRYEELDDTAATIYEGI